MMAGRDRIGKLRHVQPTASIRAADGSHGLMTDT
jgi:hypothetical protein